MSFEINAVELAPDGVGDVLFMPYYTVRSFQNRTRDGAGQYQTFLNLTNTSFESIAFRLNIREAHNGRLCAKLNVILSAKDVWTAAIQETTSGVRLFTVDTSCTSPQMTQTGTGRELLMSTDDFALPPFEDKGPNGIDRCKEGFIEVISMGHSIASNSIKEGSVAYHAKQIDEIPRNCQLIDQAFEDKIDAIQTEFNEPLNALKGMYTVINVANGIGFGGDFIALANFFSPNVVNGKGLDGISQDDLMFSATSSLDIPDLNDGKPKQSVLRITALSGKQRTFIDNWQRGVDALSAVIMRSKLSNQWTTNANLGAETSWVITMPTARYYTSANQLNEAQALRPFAELFSENADILDAVGLPQGGACNRVGIRMYDRHQTLLAQRFSPQTAGTSPLLCYAVNPIMFNGVNLLGSSIARNIDSQGSKNGWMELSFLADSAANTVAGGLGSRQSGINPNTATDVYGGLPVIGVAFTLRARGEASTNFGTLWQHTYERHVQLPGR
jgi:hypothetical protein